MREEEEEEEEEDEEEEEQQQQQQQQQHLQEVSRRSAKSPAPAVSDHLRAEWLGKGRTCLQGEESAHLLHKVFREAVPARVLTCVLVRHRQRVGAEGWREAAATSRTSGAGAHSLLHYIPSLSLCCVPVCGVGAL